MILKRNLRHFYLRRHFVNSIRLVLTIVDTISYKRLCLRNILLRSANAK